jgi:flagellar hook protein FlgE
VKNVRQQFSQGATQQSANGLDMAITGEGFFVVKPSLTSSQVSFTRNGSFTVNADRYVVDSTGANLQIYPVDGSGTVVATGIDSARNLQLPLTSGSPKGTEAVTLAINLPAADDVLPSRPIYDASNPYVFDRFDNKTYNQSSTTTIYDSLGSPVTMTNYYVKTQATPTPQWTVHTFVGDTEIMPTGQTDPLVLNFDTSGSLTSPTTAITYEQFTPSSAGPQIISQDFGNDTTQRAGVFQILSGSQDGYPVGQLEGVTVDAKGVVSASFTNGTTQALGKVMMAAFSNPSGLKQTGNAHWTVTGLSGNPRLGEAGAGDFGSIQAGALERANVDLTEELVDLIVAQRNFQANAKAIETANTLSQTIINIR